MAFILCILLHKIERMQHFNFFFFFFFAYLPSPNLGLTPPETYNPNARGSDACRGSNSLWTRTIDRYTQGRASFSNHSVTSPTSKLILQPFCRFTYVIAELILQPFRDFAYVKTHSPTLPPLYLRHSWAHSPTFPWLHLRQNSFSNPSAALPTS